MNSKIKGINTICTHVGEVEDKQFKGAVSPLYMSSSYAFQDVDVKRYPRYFNTPNQEGLAKKIAALEHCEAGLIFGSGMAAISTAVMAFLKVGDHIILQGDIYGGTYNLVVEQFNNFGIEYSFSKGTNKAAFEELVKPNTKVIYIETPSNPLLKITDLKMISDLAKKYNLISIIDNTFASPINQIPAKFGIDIVIHSATKYMGGHSDMCAGAVACSEEHREKIFHLAKNLGGSLSDYTVWLLERSMKTMGIRVRAQNENAQRMAEYLSKHDDIKAVYYPGLKSHEGHNIAKAQMKGFGGMMSFELKAELGANLFQKSLKLIKPSMSLAGVESTVLSPAETSHALLGAVERKNRGISDGLIRFSVGIEETEDLISDIEQAIKQSKKKHKITSS
ncbi:aminotransferase class I/II-fold pyridoxal phosphate-dependent enzyme [Kriegella sp. EG-1]|nr:aminotransferase class I/II-fold pyridoxal phosphate-dependent enzyme [Flavobacteriaceae bacterium EG-1]